MKDALRRVAHKVAAHLAVALLAAVIGSVVGWCAHKARASSSPEPEALQVGAMHRTGAPCRDEVISVDNARGPVSCTYSEVTSELKDGYLVCRCKKGNK